MFAIVTIAGQQIKLEEGQEIFVQKLEGAEGEVVSFDQVQLIDNDGSIQVGAPVVENAKVSATILNHIKGDKIIVFKKKRRKGYKVKNGHRQPFTRIKVNSISV